MGHTTTTQLQGGEKTTALISKLKRKKKEKKQTRKLSHFIEVDLPQEANTLFHAYTIPFTVTYTKFPCTVIPSLLTLVRDKRKEGKKS